MGRKKNLKGNSWIEGMSQKESTIKRSSSSLETQTTLGNSKQRIAYHSVSPKDDFTEERQPWIKLLFDVKTGKKCKSYSTKDYFSKSSPVSCCSLLLEPPASSYKLSHLLGDVTFEDWSSPSYLILMALRDDDNTGDGDEQIHETEVAPLVMNEISPEPKFEGRPTMTSVRSLKELCQTALAVSQLKYQHESPASEILEQRGTCDNLRRIETRHLFYSVPSLQDLSKVAMDRLNRVQTDTNSTPAKSVRTTSSSSKVSASMIPTLRNLCEAVTRGLHQQHLLSKETEGAGTASLGDTARIYTIPSLRNLAGMVVKRLRLSSRGKGSNIPSLEDSRQSCTIPSLHDLAEKVVNASETRSTVPSFDNKRPIHTVPSLRDLTETLVKSLRLNSREKVSTNSNLGSSADPIPVINRQRFTVPSLRDLCQMMIESLKYKTKEKESPSPKTNGTQQKIPSLLDLKVSRPRIQRRPKVPDSGFHPPLRAPMPQLNFSRSMFPIGTRYIAPRVRPPMTGHPFWRMNRPPNFWPRRGACEPYGVPPFGPRYGRF